MVQSRKERRKGRLQNRPVPVVEEKKVSISTTSEKPQKTKKNFFLRIYEDHYKRLLVIPIIMLLLAFVVIGIQIANTGDFVNKAVSLKGGTTLTVTYDEYIDVNSLELFLKSKSTDADLGVRELSDFGVQRGVIIEASNIPEDELLSLSKEFIGDFGDAYSLETIGSSLGQSFFRQTLIAIFIAFFFMGLVVFWYFRSVVPSLAVILAAFSDIIVTLAIFNLFGFKLSAAGVAAFLMLIGYSVDTDILLSTRVLKRKEGSIMSRIYSAMRTGLTMNFTTLVAVTIAMLVSDSEIIKQIMTIILIGLLVDIINTWIQNVGILRLYLERKKKHE